MKITVLFTFKCNTMAKGVVDSGLSELCSRAPARSERENDEDGEKNQCKVNKNRCTAHSLD